MTQSQQSPLKTRDIVINTLDNNTSQLCVWLMSLKEKFNYLLHAEVVFNEELSVCVSNNGAASADFN